MALSTLRLTGSAWYSRFMLELVDVELCNLKPVDDAESFLILVLLLLLCWEMVEVLGIDLTWFGLGDGISVAGEVDDGVAFFVVLCCCSTTSFRSVSRLSNILLIYRAFNWILTLILQWIPFNQTEQELWLKGFTFHRNLQICPNLA